MVSQICTLWPLWFHRDLFICSRMQPECPDIPSFAHFDEFFLQSDATHMPRWLPANRRRLPANRRGLLSTLFN